MTDFNINFNPKKNPLYPNDIQNGDDLQGKKKITIDFQSQFDFAESVICYVGKRAGKSYPASKANYSQTTEDYFIANKMVKKTPTPPPEFQFGPYKLKVNYYRNDDTNHGTFCYSAYNSNGEVVSNSEEFYNYVQETYGYADFDELVIKTKALCYDHASNKLIFKLPNSQFAQTRDLNRSGTVDGVGGNGTVQGSGGASQVDPSILSNLEEEAENIYNLLMQDLENNPEKLREHLDKIDAGNIIPLLNGRISDLYDKILKSEKISDDDKEYFCKKINDCLSKNCEYKGIYVEDLTKDYDKTLSKLKQNSFKNNDLIKKLQGKCDMMYYIANASEFYPENIARRIIFDVKATNALGISTTGENIGSHINMINSSNVMAVLGAYQDILNSDNDAKLVMDIIQERGLSYDTRVQYVNHIIDALVEAGKAKGLDDIDLNLQGEYARINLKAEGKKAGYADEEKIASYVNTLIARINSNSNYVTWPNGKIDGDFSQSNVTGDCWLLASIKALAMSPKGLKILNDSIKVNDRDKTVTVTLKGVGKSYTFDFYELDAARELSSGDGDVRAIEMAVNKYFREQGYVNSRPDINGNKEHVAYNILTGQGGKNFLSDSYGRIPDMWFSDSQIDNFNKTNHITCVGRNYGSENKSAYGKECGSDNKVELHSNHAYAVKGSDKDYVYLVNPWDTRDGAIIKVPRGTFKDFFNSIDEFDLE